MGISKYQWKKWIGKYVLKTRKGFQQGIGTIYSVSDIKGYYNDLREKVLEGENLAPKELPQYYMDSGEKFLFSIGVMQYGLGCYDLYLLEKEQKHLDKMLVCADWAVESQEDRGGWQTFSHLYPEHPYSSMAQGEGASLLIRAYVETKDEKYLNAARKAISFLLTPIEEGGVAFETETDLAFKEYTERPIVLNGWIFSLWGLFDYIKLTNDATAKKAYEKTLDTLERYIPHYDLGFWTRYDYSERIAAPSYHKLLIDQFTVMYDITGREVFKKHLARFERYRDSFWCRNVAFAIKAIQKLSGR